MPIALPKEDTKKPFVNFMSELKTWISALTKLCNTNRMVVENLIKKTKWKQKILEKETLLK